MREFETPVIEVKPIQVADEVTLDLSGIFPDLIKPEAGENGSPII